MVIYKFAATSLNYKDLIPFGTWDGHYNHMPTPFVEITENEYMHRTGGSVPEYQWHQQITDIPGVKTMMSLTFFKFKDNVYAVSAPSAWRCATPEEKEAGEYSIIYTQPRRYFRIGCIHEYKEKTLSKCFHEWTCVKCGFSKKVDSSD